MSPCTLIPSTKSEATRVKNSRFSHSKAVSTGWHLSRGRRRRIHCLKSCSNLRWSSSNTRSSLCPKSIRCATWRSCSGPKKQRNKRRFTLNSRWCTGRRVLRATPTRSWRSQKRRCRTNRSWKAISRAARSSSRLSQCLCATFSKSILPPFLAMARTSMSNQSLNKAS